MYLLRSFKKIIKNITTIDADKPKKSKVDFMENQKHTVENQTIASPELIAENQIDGIDNLLSFSKNIMN